MKGKEKERKKRKKSIYSEWVRQYCNRSISVRYSGGGGAIVKSAILEERMQAPAFLIGSWLPPAEGIRKHDQIALRSYSSAAWPPYHSAARNWPWGFGFSGVLVFGPVREHGVLAKRKSGPVLFRSLYTFFFGGRGGGFVWGNLKYFFSFFPFWIFPFPFPFPGFVIDLFLPDLIHLWQVGGLSRHNRSVCKKGSMLYWKPEPVSQTWTRYVLSLEKKRQNWDTFKTAR